MKSNELGDILFGVLMVWTIVAMLAAVAGLSIGWWDLLGIGLPQDPRNPAR